MMRKTFWHLLVGSALLVSACAGPGQQPTPAPPAASPSPAPAAAPAGGAGAAPYVAMKNSVRVNAADPYQAAVLVSQSTWPATHEGNRPGGLILVDPEDWPAAAVMANFIHFPTNGPVLFVRKDGIPEVTAREIARIKAAPGKALTVLLGGALDPKVEQAVKGMGLAVESIRAENPPALARAVDARYAQLHGSVPPSVVIGSVESPEFTLPAVNWIAHMPDPMLFVTKDAVPEETKQALQTRGGKANIYLLGPEAVVSKSVEQALAAYGKVTRIAGKDAYEQAVAFARFYDPATKFGWNMTTPGHNVSFVPAGARVLAVAAAPFSHLGKHAPMLWTDKESVPAAVSAYLESLRPRFKESPSEGPFNHAWITGDESLLSARAHGMLDDALEISPAATGGKGHGGH